MKFNQYSTIGENQYLNDIKMWYHCLVSIDVLHSTNIYMYTHLHNYIAVESRKKITED